MGYYLSTILCCCKGIEIWLFSTPLIGIGKFYLCLLALTNYIGNFLTISIFQGICNFRRSLGLYLYCQDAILVIVCKILCYTNICNLVLWIFSIEIA